MESQLSSWISSWIIKVFMFFINAVPKYQTAIKSWILKLKIWLFRYFWYRKERAARADTDFFSKIAVRSANCSSRSVPPVQLYTVMGGRGPTFKIWAQVPKEIKSGGNNPKIAFSDSGKYTPQASAKCQLPLGLM